MLAMLGRFASFLFRPVVLFSQFIYLTVVSLALVLSASVGWSIMLVTFLCYSWALVLVGFGWFDWAPSQSFWSRVQHGGLLVLLGTVLFACGRLFVWVGVKKLSPVVGLDDTRSLFYAESPASSVVHEPPLDAPHLSGMATLHDAREFEGIARIGGARVVRDATGQITHIGGVGVARDITGRITHIGGLDVVRDTSDRITHVLGMPVVRRREKR